MASHQLVAALSDLAVYLSSPLLNVYPNHVLDIFNNSLVAALAKTLADSGPNAVHILTSDKFPPLPFLRACFAARISWSTWIAAMGGRAEIAFQPSFIFVRLADVDSRLFWISGQSPVFSYDSGEFVYDASTLADDSEDEIFTLIDEATVWDMPDEDDCESSSTFSDMDDLDTLAELRASSPPMTARPAEHVQAKLVIEPESISDERLLAAPELDAATSSSHSRSSSRSSIFTHISFSSESTSSSNITSPSNSPSDACADNLPLPEDPDTPKPENPKKKDSNRRRRRDRIHVEPARMVLTPYDGGKTTVLTGGVMLGPGPKAAKGRTTKA